MDDRRLPPWLQALEQEDIHFIRRFVLASGSLKALASEYGVSYPTLRSRLDRLIARIQAADGAATEDPFHRSLRVMVTGGQIGAEDARLAFNATMSSATPTSAPVTGPAYLEMYAVIDGMAYFSRALNTPFTGTTPGRDVSTPFFLQSGQPLEAARLGVRFEGPGTVTLSNMSLTSQGPSGAPASSRVAYLTFGISCGLWGAISAKLSSKSQGKRVVLAGTLAIAILGAIAVAAGVAFIALGAVRDLWLPLVTMGGVAAMVYGTLYEILRHRYRNEEARRMLALDLN